MILKPCAICDADEDSVRCILCDRPVCYECARWCQAENDDANGDWVCRECLEKENENHVR